MLNMYCSFGKKCEHFLGLSRTIQWFCYTEEENAPPLEELILDACPDDDGAYSSL